MSAHLKALEFAKSPSQSDESINPAEPRDEELEALIKQASENNLKKLRLPEYSIEKWLEHNPEALERLCKILCETKGLTEFCINHSELGNKRKYPLCFWQDLCKIIASNKGIHKVNFNYSLQGASKTRVVCFFKALKENDSITELSLTNNNIGHKTNIKRKDMVCPITRELSKYLSTTHTLKVLDLEYNSLPARKKMHQLFCQALATNTSLTQLSLKQNALFLGVHKNVRRAKKSRDLFIALGKHPALTRLDLSQTHFSVLGKSEIEVFCNDFLNTSKTLTSLILNGNDMGNDEGPHYLGVTGNIQLFWNAIANNHTLQTLDVSHNSLRYNSNKYDKGLKNFHEIDHLKSRENFKAMCRAIATNKTLTTLNLGSNDLGVYETDFQCWGDLCNALSENQGITALDLRSNSLQGDHRCPVIGEAQWQQFHKMLREKSSLISLDLSGNYLKELPEASFRLLITGLNGCQALDSLGNITGNFTNAPGKIKQLLAIVFRNRLLNHFEAARGLMYRGQPSDTMTSHNTEHKVQKDQPEKSQVIGPNGRPALSAALCQHILTFVYNEPKKEKQPKQEHHITLRESVTQIVTTKMKNASMKKNS